MSGRADASVPSTRAFKAFATSGWRLSRLENGLRIFEQDDDEERERRERVRELVAVEVDAVQHDEPVLACRHPQRERVAGVPVVLEVEVPARARALVWQAAARRRCAPPRRQRSAHTGRMHTAPNAERNKTHGPDGRRGAARRSMTCAGASSSFSAGSHGTLTEYLPEGFQASSSRKHRTTSSTATSPNSTRSATNSGSSRSTTSFASPFSSTMTRVG